MRTVQCAEHGLQPWDGQVICSGCQAMYQTSDRTRADYAPAVCVCGLDLMPPAVKCSARVVCRTCYDGSPVVEGVRRPVAA